MYTCYRNNKTRNRPSQTRSQMINHNHRLPEDITVHMVHLTTIGMWTEWTSGAKVLRRMSQVCRLWRELAQPKLFHHVHLHNSTQAAIFLAVVSQGNHRLTKSVRALVLNSSDILSVQDIFRCCTHVRHAEIQAFPPLPQDAPQPFAAARQLISLSVTRCSIFIPLHDFLRFFPSLLYLKVSRDALASHPVELLPDQGSAPFHLEKFSLDGSASIRLIQWILGASVESLRSLTLLRIMEIEALEQVLTENGAQLLDLHIETIGHSTSAEIVSLDIGRHCPTLKRLTLHDTPEVSLFNTLYPTIEQLRLPATKSLQNTRLRRLVRWLNEASAVRVLSFTCTEQQAGTMLPWRTLQSLKERCASRGVALEFHETGLESG